MIDHPDEPYSPIDPGLSVRSIWAVECKSREHPQWAPAEGNLFTARDRARRAMAWMQRQFPDDAGYQFRVRRYVPA